MSADGGFEEATINPLSTFRRKWPVAGMQDAPQVVVWHFRTSDRPLARFEVTFHPAAAGEFDEGGAGDRSSASPSPPGGGRARADSLSWPGSAKKGLGSSSASSSSSSTELTVTPVTVLVKTNVGCHGPSGDIVSHYACHGHGYIELAWTNGFSLGQRHLFYRVSFARTDPLALAEPGDAVLCSLATQLDFGTMETLKSLWLSCDSNGNANVARTRCEHLVDALCLLKRKVSTESSQISMLDCLLGRSGALCVARQSCRTGGFIPPAGWATHLPNTGVALCGMGRNAAFFGYATAGRCTSGADILVSARQCSLSQVDRNRSRPRRLPSPCCQRLLRILTPVFFGLLGVKPAQSSDWLTQVRHASTRKQTLHYTTHTHTHTRTHTQTHTRTHTRRVLLAAFGVRRHQRPAQVHDGADPARRAQDGAPSVRDPDGVCVCVCVCVSTSCCCFCCGPRPP
jgi:hypothetical protein